MYPRKLNPLKSVTPDLIVVREMNTSGRDGDSGTNHDGDSAPTTLKGTLALSFDGALMLPKLSRSSWYT
ncbi:hypothetical protein MspRI1_16920 [Marinobacter sp. RI1]